MKSPRGDDEEHLDDVIDEIDDIDDDDQDCGRLTWLEARTSNLVPHSLTPTATVLLTYLLLWPSPKGRPTR